MMINIKGKEVELRYSFNSFKYMKDFSLQGLEEVEDKPFLIVPMLESLLMGAVNNNPKVKFTVVDVQAFLEEYMENESLTGLLEELMDKLQKSMFFKSLQRNGQ